MRLSTIYPLILSIAVMVSSVGVTDTINVPVDFETIQKAINGAEPGDTIVVASGEYKDDIVIENSIKIYGSGTNVTTLFGNIIVNDADGIVIDGLKIDGQGADDAHFGIWCESSILTISNNTITGYHHGIGSQSSSIVVENNTIIENSSVGMEIVAAFTTLIKGNTIADTVDTGIRIALSQDHVSIMDNIITGNRVAVACVESDPVIRRNVIEENGIGLESTQNVFRDGPDLGRDDDPGLNIIQNNDVQIANMNRQLALQAKYNYWGSSTGPDVTSFDGKVDYKPWLAVDPRETQPVNSPGKRATTWGRIRGKALSESNKRRYLIINLSET